jgi:hypothetical protein
MGTSTDYSAPPAWGQLKGGVTRAAGHALTPARAGELLSDHVATNGGARQIASGGGVLGAGRSSQSVARNIGGFISQVANVGLSETLRQNGLQELMGRPASEVLLGILALCSGTNGSIDAVDARSAASRLMDDLCKQAVTAEDVELILKAHADGEGLADLLMKYFGYYLYEQFCRLFFAQLVKKHGEQRAESFLDDILDFIHAALRNHTLGLNVAEVNWFGNDGDRMASEIMQQTLEVFEQ